MASAALFVSACGSSSDTAVSADSGNSAGSTNPPAALTAPTDQASAVEFQYQRVGETMTAMQKMSDGQYRATAALNDARYSEWDAFWNDTYPVLAEDVRRASVNLQASEEHIRRLVYGLNPQQKLVPEAIFVLTVVAIVADIYNKEYGPNGRLTRPPSQPEKDAFFEQRVEYYKDTMKLPDIQARTRARADVGSVGTLRAVRDVGIPKATTFVIDAGLKPAAGLVSKTAGGVLDIREVREKTGMLKDSLTALLWQKSCKTGAPAAKRLVASQSVGAALEESETVIASKDVDNCLLYFCSTGENQCDQVPPGEWEGAVFLPGHLRDVDLDVRIGSGLRTTLRASPVAVTDIGKAPTQAACSQTQNQGGNTADTRVVELGQVGGTFNLGYNMQTIKDRIQVFHDRKSILDTGCVSGSATKTIPYDGLSSFVSISVLPNCDPSQRNRTTVWSYSVTCPAAP